MMEGIDSIPYSADQWDEAGRFFKDWGLEELAASRIFCSLSLCFSVTDRFGGLALGFLRSQLGGLALDSLRSRLVGWLWTRGMRCKKSPKTRAGCFGW